MEKISIETLTPVHIGSGRELNANTEFLFFREDDENLLVIIDEKKVLDIIGKENINTWISIINNKENLKDYLLKRKPGLQVSDFCKYRMLVYGSELRKHKTLKEQLRDARGISYIPGSSIKGAIRTAVLSNQVKNHKDFASKNLKNHKNIFSAENVEKYLFGPNPNQSIFRFLHVGDAYFEYENIATKFQILNSYKKGWEFKRDSSHLVECINFDAESSFNMKINNTLQTKNHFKKSFRFTNLPELFSLINQHTIELLNSEVEFWEEETQINEVIFKNYFDKIKELLKKAENCDENACILRIGFGSGWNFITGAWAKDIEITNDEKYNHLVKFIRRRNYPDFIPFPKTKKMDEDGDMTGFVKLKIL